MGFAPDRPACGHDDVALVYARALKAPPAPVTSFDQRWGDGFGGGANAMATLRSDPAISRPANMVVC